MPNPDSAIRNFQNPGFITRRRLVRLALVLPMGKLGCIKHRRPELLEMTGYDTAGWAHDVSLEAGKLYVSDRQGGFLIFEQSDLGKPPVVVTPVQDVISLAPHGGSPLLAARFEGLVLISPTGQAVARFSNGDIANTVATRGEFAYCAYGKRGLVVAFVGDASLRFLADLPTPGWSHDVKLWGDRALLADWDYGLRVVDIRNPRMPAEIAAMRTPATSISVAVDEGRGIIAVADGHGGVALASLNGVAAPELLGRHGLGLNPGDLPHPAAGGWAHGVAWGGRYVFVANWKRGLAVIDTGDPHHPRLVLERPTGGTALGVAVERESSEEFRVYLADGEAGLRVFRFRAG